MIDQNQEKVELFDFVRDKYPDVTNTYLNYLLKGISFTIGDTISSTITKLNNNKELFILYYENRWFNDKPYVKRLLLHIKEWYLLKKITTKRKNHES